METRLINPQLPPPPKLLLMLPFHIQPTSWQIGFTLWYKLSVHYNEGWPLSEHASLVSTGTMAENAPSVATEAVLKRSCDLPENMTKIRGYDFNQGRDLQGVMKSYLTTGFQASRLGLAIQEINHMVKKCHMLVSLIENNLFFNCCSGTRLHTGAGWRGQSFLLVND